MIIECGHCGAPLDVKPNDQRTKCRYCGTWNQVKSTRTIAFETPPGWQPPPQWTPPVHMAANSGQVLTYKAASSGVAIALVGGLVAVLGVAGSIAAQVMSSVSTTVNHVADAEREVHRATEDANEAIRQALAQASAAQDQINDAVRGIPGARVPGAASPSLLTDAGVRDVLSQYKQAVGSSALMATRIVFHDTHSSGEFQSAKNPAHVDGYSYHGGKLSGPEPVRLTGSEKTNLKRELFNPEQTALLRLESLRTQAIGQLGYEQAKVTHVIAERDRGKTVVRVYVTSPRESGYVAFDERGKVTRTSR